MTDKTAWQILAEGQTDIIQEYSAKIIALRAENERKDAEIERLRAALENIRDNARTRLMSGALSELDKLDIIAGMANIALERCDD